MAIMRLYRRIKRFCKKHQLIIILLVTLIVSTLNSIIPFAISQSWQVYSFQVQKSYQDAEIRASNDPHAHVIIVGDRYGVGFIRDSRDGVNLNCAIHFSVSAILTHLNGTKAYIP